MEQYDKREGGAVTYWAIGRRSDKAKVAEAFQAAGFEAEAPGDRPLAARLHDALVDCCACPTRIVRPVKKDVWSVVSEYRSQQAGNANRYEPACNATIVTPDYEGAVPFVDFQCFEPEWSAVADQCGEYPEELRRKVRERFEWYEGVTSQGQLAQSLVNVCSTLRGTTLRPSGAVYWLAPDMLDRWKQLGEGVEAAALDKNTVYLLRLYMDLDSARAIFDAITYEVENELSTIEAEVGGGDLGRRALDNRAEFSRALAEKVKMYEGILQRPLERLGEQCERTRQAAAVAAMAASAGAVRASSKAIDPPNYELFPGLS